MLRAQLGVFLSAAALIHYPTRFMENPYAQTIPWRRGRHLSHCHPRLHSTQVGVFAAGPAAAGFWLRDVRANRIQHACHWVC